MRGRGDALPFSPRMFRMGRGTRFFLPMVFAFQVRISGCERLVAILAKALGRYSADRPWPRFVGDESQKV